VRKTVPADDQVVATAPERVAMEFNEPVETAFGALRVYDAAAHRVDRGDLIREGAETVAVEVDRPLAEGTYTVTWRVVSADSHPIQGAFVFHVGAPGANSAGIAAQVLDAGAPTSVTFAFATVRFLGFLFLLLAAGGVAILALVLGSARPTVRRSLWTAVAVAAAVLALLAPLAIVLQGASAGGFTFWEALDWSVISAVLDTRFGEVTALRILLAGVLLVAALVLRGRSTGTPARVTLGAAALASLGLLCVPAAAGHAGVSGALAFVSDVAHVGAAAVWTGGLAFVVAALVLAGTDRWKLATRAVPRFSTAAVVSVAVLIVAGTINGYLQVRVWEGLWETTYGLLLLAKLALVVPLLALGAFNNRYVVPRLRRGIASLRERRRFMQAAGVELALMVTIVAVTAVLVSEPPAQAVVAPKGPSTTATQIGAAHVEVEVEPGTAGTNNILISVTDHGATSAPPVAEITVAASLPSEDIGPLEFEAHPVGGGEFVVHGADLAIAGDWEFEIQVLRGEFDRQDETVTIPIRREP
jgi:copper transport protein